MRRGAVCGGESDAPAAEVVGDDLEAAGEAGVGEREGEGVREAADRE